MLQRPNLLVERSEPPKVPVGYTVELAEGTVDRTCLRDVEKSIRRSQAVTPAKLVDLYKVSPKIKRATENAESKGARGQKIKYKYST